MKLTAIDIQQQQFRRAFRGLDRQEVLQFLELVAQRLEELTRENTELRGQVRALDREVDAFREREGTLKSAMLTAQRAVDEIREQARKEAELVVTEAQLRAEKLMFDVHKRLGGVHEEIQQLKGQRARLLEELRAVLATHGKLLALHDDDGGQDVAPVTVLEHVRAPLPPKVQLG